MTGHVTERMMEHYSHIGTEEKRVAVSRMLRLLEPPAATGDRTGDREADTKKPAGEETP